MKFNIFLLLVCVFALAAFTVRQTSVSSAACAACDNLTGVARIVCLADEFKASLSASQTTALQLDYNLTNAKKWSNLPVTLSPRIGIRFGDLSADQLVKAKALVQAALSTKANEGYAEAEQLWAADQYLSQNGGGSTYGSGQYYMAFLGTPSTTGTWELQTGGHHLAVANTYAKGTMSGATPSFRAIEPFAAFQSGSNTYQPMLQERDALAAMLTGLSTTELAAAKLSSTFSDIVLGPGKDWQFPATKSGIKCSQLTAAQKNLVLAAIRTYVEDIDEENAAAFMALYTSQIDDTYLAYTGNASLTQQRDYVRIDGPRVWIEYSVQNGIILTPAHPHSVWRDHTSDYGGLGNPSVATTAPAAFQGAFRIFPNPVQSQSQVEIGLETASVVSLRVFDSLGRACSGGFKLNMAAGNHTLPLDLQYLPTGNFKCVLEVKNNEGTYAATQAIAKI